MNEMFAPAPTDPHNLSPLGLPTENLNTDFLNGVDMAHTYDVAAADRAAHMQDPFGLNRVQQPAEHQTTAPAPQAAEFNFKVPTAAEMAEAQEDQFMTQAKKAARKAIDASVGYDTQAALAAKINAVNLETQKQQLVAAAAAQAEQRQAVQRRIIDEAETDGTAKKTKGGYTLAA